MGIGEIKNGHMQLYPHFVKNISHFPMAKLAGVVKWRKFKSAPISWISIIKWQISKLLPFFFKV